MFGAPSASALIRMHFRLIVDLRALAFRWLNALIDCASLIQFGVLLYFGLSLLLDRFLLFLRRCLYCLRADRQSNREPSRY